MVNGVASGWAFDLVLACDLRIGSEKARFNSAFVKVGLTPATGGVWLMPRIMGLPKAAEMIFTGDFVEAKEAERLGILNKVVPAEELEKETMDLARRLAQAPPLAIRLAKLQLYKDLQTNLEDALKMSATCQAICMASEDFKEGMAAFAEKRPAKFKGR
jgi:2-(1,2-epoxy-1,2-dihydrophenyl)acetyl-CoA isomerase